MDENKIKEHPDFKMYVDNNDGIEDPNLLDFCLKTADYLLKVPYVDTNGYFKMRATENGEEVTKTIYKETKEFDDYTQLLEYALNICEKNYFVLHNLSGNKLSYFTIDGNVTFPKPMENRDAEAVVKQVHRNNIISQI